MRNRIVGIVAALAVCGATAPAAAASLPVVYNSAYGLAHSSPTASPPGANDFACRPTAAHPRPVILVHGTFEDMANNWQALRPCCPTTATACSRSTTARSEAAARSASTGPGTSKVRPRNSVRCKVLAATGTSRVDIVGHSQGGMMPRYYMRFDKGAAKVHTLVGLAPSNHTRPSMACSRCQATSLDPTRRWPTARCAEQQTRSAFMNSSTNQPPASGSSAQVVEGRPIEG